MISDQAHYSIERALRIMGFGDEGIIRVSNNMFKMDLNLLHGSLEQARLRGPGFNPEKERLNAPNTWQQCCFLQCLKFMGKAFLKRMSKPFMI